MSNTAINQKILNLYMTKGGQAYGEVTDICRKYQIPNNVHEELRRKGTALHGIQGVQIGVDKGHPDGDKSVKITYHGHK